MGFVLADGHSFALLDERAIFLDIRKDRYFCLAPSVEAAFRRLVAEGTAAGGDEPVFANLVRDGILQRVSGQGMIRPFRLDFPPRASLLDEPRQSAALWRQALAALELARVQRALTRRSLQHLAKKVAACSQEHGGNDSIEDDARCTCWAFEAAGLWLTPLRNCLSRSLALTGALRARGHACDLVIGVAINPFQAHSWVQFRDLVLNDRLERVGQFTPVMAA